MIKECNLSFITPTKELLHFAVFVFLSLVNSQKKQEKSRSQQQLLHAHCFCWQKLGDFGGDIQKAAIFEQNSLPKKVPKKVGKMRVTRGF